MSFILKWIYLQSAFIKPPSIKEQHLLILITEHEGGRGRGSAHRCQDASTAARTREAAGHRDRRTQKRRQRTEELTQDRGGVWRTAEVGQHGRQGAERNQWLLQAFIRQAQRLLWITEGEGPQRERCAERHASDLRSVSVRLTVSS